MKTRRLLPYMIALVLLAWVLGSLARGGTAGGSILANSTWLVYAVEILPLVALGLIAAFILSLVVNWKFIAEALGFGMTRRRRTQPKRSMRVQIIIWMATWTAAIAYLEVTCHGFNCSSTNTIQTTSTITHLVSENGPITPLPIVRAALSFVSFVDTNIFAMAFFGVLTVSSVIMAKAVMVHLKETHNEKVEWLEVAQEHGREAVRAAIKILDEGGEGDARTRIVACYQKMIRGASDLGAPVGPDKTARELERGIRSMFLLKGPGIAKLTNLFEEARYSLHSVTWEDASRARECLVEISEELSRTVIIEA